MIHKGVSKRFGVNCLFDKKRVQRDGSMYNRKRPVSAAIKGSFTNRGALFDVVYLYFVAQQLLNVTVHFTMNFGSTL